MGAINIYRPVRDFPLRTDLCHHSFNFLSDRRFDNFWQMGAQPFPGLTGNLRRGSRREIKILRQIFSTMPVTTSRTIASIVSEPSPSSISDMVCAVSRSLRFSRSAGFSFCFCCSANILAKLLMIPAETSIGSSGWLFPPAPFRKPFLPTQAQVLAPGLRLPEQPLRKRRQ